MKTRVIRYWHKLDWLYKVEEYVQATGEERWISIYGSPSDGSTPKKGEWYWAFVEGALSRERALQLAEHVSKGIQDCGVDVVAEFDEASSSST